MWVGICGDVSSVCFAVEKSVVVLVPCTCGAFVVVIVLKSTMHGVIL